MTIGKLIVVSLSGGKFTTNGGGTLSYSGGDAHATSLTLDTKFDDLKSEIADMWEYDLHSFTIKYFIPNNNRTLITISTNRDIHHFLEFHEDFAFADVYVITPSPLAPSEAPGDCASIPYNRSSDAMPDPRDPVSPPYWETSPPYYPTSPPYKIRKS